VIFADFARACGQLGDPRFLRVLLMGAALTLAVLAGVTAAVLGIVNLLIPDSFTLPWIGEVTGVDVAASWAFGAAMIVGSVVLMPPVAAACTGLFLERVVDAVEDRHYSWLPAVIPMSFFDSLKDAINFAGVVVAVNLLGLLVYGFVGPLAPLLFWAINGYLLGREYFTLVAQRRLGRDRAQALRRRHGGLVWLSGVLMALPLSLPLVNLLIPVLAVATFTHLVHRLDRATIAA